MNKYTVEQKSVIKKSEVAGRVAARVGKSRPKIAGDLKRQSKAATALRIAKRKITKADKEAKAKRALVNKLKKQYMQAAANAKVAAHVKNVKEKQLTVVKKKKTAANAAVTAKREKIRGYKTVKKSMRKAKTQSMYTTARKVATMPFKLVRTGTKKIIGFIDDPAGMGKAAKKVRF